MLERIAHALRVLWGAPVTRRDTQTPDLFAVPQPAAPVPASMDYRATLAHLIADMLRESGHDRYALAAMTSRLVGKEVSKYMLDAYTAESREEFNLPAYLIPALETACESHAISNWLAGVRGARLMVGRDAVTAEIGRIERQRDELTEQIRAIKARLRRTP